MSNTSMNDNLDLGSEPTEDFDPWADEDELDLETSYDTGAVEEPAQEPAESTEQPPKVKEPAAAKATEAAQPQKPKDADKSQQSIYEKLPVFEFAGASEDISDSSLTFDELRIAKAADFPELDDGKRVSWSVEYGKINKEVADAKGTSIAKMKSDIESSKAFIDALKKSKDKSPVCKVKPRVKAQVKGTIPASGYKGVFTCMEEVEAAGKVISILPAKDGKVYEVRKNTIGRFITPVSSSEMLSDVKAGYTPAFGIPRIPMDTTMKIISFFRYLTLQGGSSEALVNVYWDTLNEAFVVDTPTQIVSKISVHSEENPEYFNKRYIHFMDIHSHNSMRAFFSAIDDQDEKATRLYTVIGRLDSFFPEIKTRISNGGKFLEIDPVEVFEYISEPFPPEWKDNVKHRTGHGDYARGKVAYTDTEMLKKDSCRCCLPRNEGGGVI